MRNLWKMTVIVITAILRAIGILGVQAEVLANDTFPEAAKLLDQRMAEASKPV